MELIHQFNDYIFLDTETTGLNINGDDEVLEIAIIDNNNNVLLNSLVKPKNKSSWIEAEIIHGISPKAVKNAPTLEDLEDQIIEAIKNKVLVIYNANYDKQFFNDYILSKPLEIVCCMVEYQKYFNFSKWQKLTKAADYFDHVWEGSAHRALADTKATRTVFNNLVALQIKDRLFENQDSILEVSLEQFNDAQKRDLLKMIHRLKADI